MASYLIQEAIAGADLFVPDANDYFTIDAGSMPNGSDSIQIDGATSTDYKAFVPSPSLSPNLLRSRDYNTVLTASSIVFWVKMSPPTIPSGHASVVSRMFGVFNNLTSGQPSSTSDTSWWQGGALWHVYASGTSGVDNKITVAKRSANSGGGASFSIESGTIPTDTWTMVTISMSADATDGGIFLDDSSTRSNGTNFPSGEGTFSSDSITDPHFVIGNYQTDAYSEARAGVWNIGKFSIHDRRLNVTERTALYNAMTT